MCIEFKRQFSFTLVSFSGKEINTCFALEKLESGIFLTCEKVESKTHRIISFTSPASSPRRVIFLHYYTTGQVSSLYRVKGFSRNENPRYLFNRNFRNYIRIEKPTVQLSVKLHRLILFL